VAGVVPIVGNTGKPVGANVVGTVGAMNSS